MDLTGKGAITLMMAAKAAIDNEDKAVVVSLEDDGGVTYLEIKFTRREKKQ